MAQETTFLDRAHLHFSIISVYNSQCNQEPLTLDTRRNIMYRLKINYNWLMAFALGLIAGLSKSSWGMEQQNQIHSDKQQCDVVIEEHFNLKKLLEDKKMPYLGISQKIDAFEYLYFNKFKSNNQNLVSYRNALIEMKHSLTMILDIFDAALKEKATINNILDIIPYNSKNSEIALRVLKTKFVHSSNLIEQFDTGNGCNAHKETVIRITESVIKELTNCYNGEEFNITNSQSSIQSKFLNRVKNLLYGETTKGVNPIEWKLYDRNLKQTFDQIKIDDAPNTISKQLANNK